jgi:hypothetical protein
VILQYVSKCGPSTLRATVTLKSQKFTSDRRNYEYTGEFLSQSGFWFGVNNVPASDAPAKNHPKIAIYKYSMWLMAERIEY